jgi:hypothetical protein
MRHLPIIVGAALLSAGLLAGSSRADAAMPALSIDRPDAVSSALEKVGYYYRRRWYGRPYYHRPYYRPYGYYRPYYRPYYGYGYGYRWGRPYRYRY